MNQAQAIINGAFELSALDSVDMGQVTHDVALVEDADGNAVVGFKIVGKNSPEYVAANNQVRRENIKRASKRSKAIDASTDDGADAVARTVENNERTVASAVVVGWFGFNLEGSPMNFDKAYVEKLLNKYPTWVQKVSNALENDANFMKV